jgi:hypothetical protein
LIQNLRDKFNRWRVAVEVAPLSDLSDGIEKIKRGRPKKEPVKSNEPGTKVPLPTEGKFNPYIIKEQAF